MTAGAAQQLEELARRDPSVSTLALLQAELARESERPVWTKAMPAMPADPDAGVPLLHGHELHVSRRHVRGLLERLAGLVDQSLRSAISEALDSRKLDELELIEASINQDPECLERLAEQAGVELPRLAALGHLVSTPLLRACGRQAEPLLEPLVWEEGYCPVCAAWPALAEVRGVERVRWLRCGRCGAGWSRPHQICAYCGNRDYQTQSYLSTPDRRESQQAVACEACHGYLKSVSSMVALSTVEVALEDLRTMHLDVAVLRRGYSRPSKPGFVMRVQVRAR